ncbi:hypothetical protein [Pseudonocardia abyssalis]|uniref:Uncharacterized protein n=1 Tax=Pseudonocardia abyssalis TaxID=2792008 RepID=A0ABS6UVR1_9PSEU|nr:hypothetical protein [Pseudonocardia abyssalis]MBW0114863.1 hypothetical protein [Pseudonocardia abyssalis]MBW0136351.1 hypothetical protein [Pseudonocardia abyssalis]
MSGDLPGTVPTMGPGSMLTGWWTRMPLGPDGELLWARIVRLMPPDRTLEDRWAVQLRRGTETWWVKCASSVHFPVCDVDPT